MLSKFFVFTALLKTWERNEKGTENMSDMPAPFTMQFFKKSPGPLEKSRALRALDFDSLRSAMAFSGFFCKSLLEGLIYTQKVFFFRLENSKRGKLIELSIFKNTEKIVFGE